MEELAEVFNESMNGGPRTNEALDGLSMRRYSRMLREVAAALQTEEENWPDWVAGITPLYSLNLQDQVHEKGRLIHKQCP